jgi:hypothetical protein
MDAYLITVEAMDQYTWNEPRDPENKFTHIVQELDKVPREYLIDYLRLALGIHWSGGEITKINYRYLSFDEIEVIRDNYLKLMDRWELAREMAKRHIESDYMTDGGNWRT